MANLTGAAQNQVNQNLNPVWSLASTIGGAYGTQQDSKIKSLQQQLGLNYTGLGVNTNYQNQQAGYSGQRLDLNQEQLGINQGSLNRQLNEYLPQQEALAGRGFALNDRELNEQTASNMRGLTSSATARGSMVTEGTRQGFKDIYSQLAFGKEGLDISRKGSELSFKQQRDQLADDQKQIDIASKSLGIDRNELKTRTEYAINQLGLEATLGAQDIIQAINDVSAGLDNPLIQLLPQIYQLTGLRPTASTGGSGGGGNKSSGGGTSVRRR